MKIAVTGHQCRSIRCFTTELIRRFEEQFKKTQPDTVIVGMACGSDIIAGYTALEMNLAVDAVMPWAGHKNSQYIQKCDFCKKMYDIIWDHCANRIVLDDSLVYPGPNAFHARNRYMVDNADSVVAYWSGSVRSGTGSTVRYANSKGKLVTNIYGVAG